MDIKSGYQITHLEKALLMSNILKHANYLGVLRPGSLTKTVILVLNGMLHSIPFKFSIWR